MPRYPPWPRGSAPLPGHRRRAGQAAHSGQLEAQARSHRCIRSGNGAGLDSGAGPVHHNLDSHPTGPIWSRPLVRIVGVTLPPTGPRWRPWPLGARSRRTAALGVILGIVTALVALGVAQVVAAIIASQPGAPVNAVGELS